MLEKRRRHGWGDGASLSSEAMICRPNGQVMPASTALSRDSRLGLVLALPSSSRSSSAGLGLPTGPVAGKTTPSNKELKLTKPGKLWRLRSLTPVFDGPIVGSCGSRRRLACRQ